MGYMVGKGHQHTGPGTSMTQFVEPNYRYGMGACCASCAHGGTCGGMGLFDSGTDISGWGWPEWAVVIFGGYMVMSTVFTTKRAVGRVSGSIRKRSRRAKRKRELKEELRAL